MATALLNWPPRKNPSQADQVELHRAEIRHNYGVEGKVVFFTSWQEVLEHRPLDVPLCTASQGRAVIVVLVSSQLFPSPDAVQALAAARRPFGLHIRTFDEGGYPVLRVNVSLPDGPKALVWLEAPLDVRDGDAQDFVSAIVADEHIELMLAHEDLPPGILLGLHAPGAGAVAGAEARRAIEVLPASPSATAFKSAVTAMEQAFPQAFSGVDPKRVIPMRLLGTQEESRPSVQSAEEDAVGELDHGGVHYRVFGSLAAFVSELVRVRHAALQTTLADVRAAFKDAFAGVGKAFGPDSAEAHALTGSDLFCGACGIPVTKADKLKLLVPYPNVQPLTECPKCGGTDLIVLTRL